jgi:hypothetical protein
MNKGDIFIGRFVDENSNFEYRVGRSNSIGLTVGEYGTNRHWTEAQQVIVYGGSTVFVDAGLAMEYALNTYNELSHLQNPVEVIFYDTVFAKWTKEEALEITCRPSVPEGVLSTSNDNGVCYGAK